jgi:type II secretory pathway pseudopilin PulG
MKQRRGVGFTQHYFSPKSSAGFTLVEVLLYSAIFAVVAGLLTGILTTSVRTQNRENASNEVSVQLDFVLSTVQRLVRDASLVDVVYEGTSTSTPCSTYCTARLRMEDTSREPTIIRSDAGGIYLKEGSGDEVTLTTDKIIVNSFILTKSEGAGGHATLQVDSSFTYNSSNPQLAITKTLQSAISRVTAATFDSDLIPNADNAWDIGQTTARWQDLVLSNDLTVGGNLSVSNDVSVTNDITVGGNIAVNYAADNALISTDSSLANTALSNLSPAGQVSLFGNFDIAGGDIGSLFGQYNTDSSAFTGLKIDDTYGSALGLMYSDWAVAGNPFTSGGTGLLFYDGHIDFYSFGDDIAGFRDGGDFLPYSLSLANNAEIHFINDTVINDSGTPNDVSIYLSGPDALTIRGGNVGIGATSPSALLDLDAGSGRGIIEVDGSTGGCLKIRDTDDAGWTYCTALDGTLSCSVSAC